VDTNNGKKVIDADFEDILTWEEAKDIFKG
jgi:hypothetical protein